MALCRIVFVLVLFGLVSAKLKQYDGFTLYEVVVENTEQEMVFNKLESELNLDVWSRATPEQSGRILVSKSEKTEFENELSTAGIKHTIVVENMEELIELERKQLSEADEMSAGINMYGIAIDTMHTYDQVNSFLEQLANNYTSVNLLSQGTTFEGRPINYIRISSSNFTDYNKPVVFIQSLIQAREWISLPVALHAINKLVTNITDSDLVNTIDWIILPIANPDGYHYSSTISRLWTKNRRAVGSECVGVNINRNFDINFGAHSSSNICSDNYHGPDTESEIETRSIRDILILHQGRIKLFLNLQSFGSHILYGFGTGGLPGNALILNFLGVQMTSIINAFNSSKDNDYTVGNIAAVVAAESGNVMDYATLVRNVPYSYTIKLPSYGNSGSVSDNGYIVDPSYFTQAAEETWEAIKYCARFVRDNPF
ncbi:carboxypeptidase B-like [Galleria mellonella]|uniref:Carboxypeptidase B-like n=1 Tax=Galleria mellonella TaxID=7137 RepID=A0ABM3MEF5_GALME|nr:carboxypeptidase B-like [Galleria mellonella]